MPTPPSPPKPPSAQIARTLSQPISVAAIGAVAIALAALVLPPDVVRFGAFGLWSLGMIALGRRWGTVKPPFDFDADELFERLTEHRHEGPPTQPDEQETIDTAPDEDEPQAGSFSRRLYGDPNVRSNDSP